MNLSELITTHKGARSYADLERDCGGYPSSKRLQQIVNRPIKNFPDPPTVKALARGLRVSQSAVVLAAAESLDLDVNTSMPRLVELLPAGARRLNEQQAAALAHLVATIVDSPNPGDEVEYQDDDIEPTVNGVLKAQARFLEEQERVFGGDWVTAARTAHLQGNEVPPALLSELDVRAAAQVAASMTAEELRGVVSPAVRALDDEEAARRRLHEEEQEREGSAEQAGSNGRDGG